ncbi:hypothetical protein HK405_012337, partial [Cladochytrium tenue]
MQAYGANPPLAASSPAEATAAAAAGMVFDIFGIPAASAGTGDGGSRGLQWRQQQQVQQLQQLQQMEQHEQQELLRRLQAVLDGRRALPGDEATVASAARNELAAAFAPSEPLVDPNAPVQARIAPATPSTIPSRKRLHTDSAGGLLRRQAAGQQLVTPTSAPEQVRMFHSAAIPQGALATLGESPTGSPQGHMTAAAAAVLRARSDSSRSPPGPLGARSLGDSIISLSSASASPTTAGAVSTGTAVRAAVANLTPTTTPPAGSPLVSGPAQAAEPAVAVAVAATATGRAAVSRPPGSRRRTWIGWRGHTLPRLSSLNTAEFPVVLQPRDAARLAAETAEAAGLPVEAAAAPWSSGRRRRSRTVTTGGGIEALGDAVMAEVDGGGDAAATASSEGGGDGGGATSDDDGGSGELSPAAQDRQRRRRNAEAARRTRQRKAQTLRYFRERSTALEEQERALRGQIAALTEEQTVLRARNDGLEARIEAMEAELAAVRDALVAAGIQMRHGLVVGGADVPGPQELPGAGGSGVWS